MLYNERKEVMGKYLDVHGAVPRRERMITTGMELLKKKGEERKAHWQIEVQERKDRQELEITRLALEKSYKQEKAAKKDKQFHVLEDAASKDALQQVPQCSVDEKETMVRRAAQVKVVFHFMFSSATLLILAGLGMLVYAYFTPIAQQQKHKEEMLAYIIVGSPTDIDPEKHYQDWMLMGSKPEDAVSMDYYLYNITNVEEVLADTGASLDVKEIGPYRYKRYHRKINVEFETTNADSEIRKLRLQNDLCTYSMVYDYRFVGGAGKLTDTITTLNVAYLRVLGELKLYETTDRYLVAHFAAGLLKEQGLLMKERIKRLGLNKVLAKVPATRNRKMYLDLRVQYAIKGMRKLFQYALDNGWGFYGFTTRFAANSNKIGDNPEIAAFQLDPQLSPALCRADDVVFQDVNLNPSKPSTCITQEFADLLWNAENTHSLLHIPASDSFTDESLAGGVIRIYKGGGFTWWLKMALWWFRARDDKEASRILVKEVEDVFSIQYNTNLAEIEVLMIFNYVNRVFRTAFPYFWLSRQLHGSALEPHEPRACAALVDFVDNTPQPQVADIALALWEPKSTAASGFGTIIEAQKLVSLTSIEGHDRWMTAAMGEFYPPEFSVNASGWRGGDSSTDISAFELGEAMRGVVQAAGFSLSDPKFSATTLNASLSFVDLDSDGVVDNVELGRTVHYATHAIHSRARLEQIVVDIHKTALQVSSVSLATPGKLGEKPIAEVSVDVVRCLAAHVHQSLPVLLSTFTAEMAFGEVESSPVETDMPEIVVLAAESEVIRRSYAVEPADIPGELRWHIKSYASVAAAADALEVREKWVTAHFSVDDGTNSGEKVMPTGAALLTAQQEFSKAWASGKTLDDRSVAEDEAVEWPWALGSNPKSGETSTVSPLDETFAVALWDDSNAFSLTHNEYVDAGGGVTEAGAKGTGASAQSTPTSFFPGSAPLLSVERSGANPTHVADYTTMTKVILRDHAQNLVGWKAAALARSSVGNSRLFLNLARKLMVPPGGAPGDYSSSYFGLFDFDLLPVLTASEVTLVEKWRGEWSNDPRDLYLPDEEDYWLQEYGMHTNASSPFANSTALATFPVTTPDLLALANWLMQDDLEISADYASAWATSKKPGNGNTVNTPSTPRPDWPARPHTLRTHTPKSDWEELPKYARTTRDRDGAVVPLVTIDPVAFNGTLASELWNPDNDYALNGNASGSSSVGFAVVSASAYLAMAAAKSNRAPFPTDPKLKLKVEVKTEEGYGKHPLNGVYYEGTPETSGESSFAPWMQAADARALTKDSLPLLSLVLSLLFGEDTAYTSSGNDDDDRLHGYDLEPVLTSEEKTQLVQLAQGGANAAGSSSSSNRFKAYSKAYTAGGAKQDFPLTTADIEALASFLDANTRALSLSRYWLVGEASSQKLKELHLDMPAIARFEPCRYSRFCTWKKVNERDRNWVPPTRKLQDIDKTFHTFSDLSRPQQYYVSSILLGTIKHPMSLTSSKGYQFWLDAHAEFKAAFGGPFSGSPEAGATMLPPITSRTSASMQPSALMKFWGEEFGTYGLEVEVNATLRLNDVLLRAHTRDEDSTYRHRYNATLSTTQLAELSAAFTQMRRLATGWQLGPLLYSPSTGWSQTMGQGFIPESESSTASSDGGKGGTHTYTYNAFAKGASAREGVQDGLGTATRSWWNFNAIQDWLDCSAWQPTGAFKDSALSTAGFPQCIKLANGVNRHAHLASFQPTQARAVALYLSSWLGYNPEQREYIYDEKYLVDRGFGPQPSCSRPDDVFGTVNAPCSDMGSFALFDLDGDRDDTTVNYGVTSLDDIVGVQWAMGSPLGYDMPGVSSYAQWLRTYRGTMGIGNMPVWGDDLSPLNAAAVWGGLVKALNGRVAGSYFVENHPLLDLSGVNVLAVVYQFSIIYLPWTDKLGRRIAMPPSNEELYKEAIWEQNKGGVGGQAAMGEAADLDTTWAKLSKGLDVRNSRCTDYFEPLGGLTCKQGSDLAQYIMWLGKVKVWDERLEMPGTSKGIFVTGTADMFLNTGYRDALLSLQGTDIIRPLGVKFVDVDMGGVPSMIRDHNRTHGRGRAFVGPMYVEDALITEPGVNITVYPFPRTMQTGVHDVKLRGEINFLQRPDVANPDSLYWKPGGRSKELFIFQSRLTDAIQGHVGFGEDYQFPASMDVFNSKTYDEFPFWDDDILRTTPLKFDRTIAAESTATYGRDFVQEGEHEYGFGSIGTELRRYKHSVSNAPRYFSDSRDPTCMIDVSNMYQGVGFYVGKPGYGGCDTGVLSGVPDTQRVDGFRKDGEFETSENYFDYEPVTGRVYYHNMHQTMYASQPFSMEFFYTGVKPAMVPYTTLRKHHAHLTHATAAEYESTVLVLKTKMAVTLLFGVVTGISLLITGLVLYIKTQKRWQRTQVIYPVDDFKMRVEARKQVLYQENTQAYEQAKRVFKNKSKKVKQHKREHDEQLAAAMAETHQRNAEIFSIIDGMVQTDEKGDKIVAFGDTPNPSPKKVKIPTKSTPKINPEADTSTEVTKF